MQGEGSQCETQCQMPGGLVGREHSPFELTALVLESVGWHFSSEHLLCAGFVLRSGVTAVNKTDEDSALRKSTS